jgi:hypothetical protein
MATETVNGTPADELAGMAPVMARRQLELAALGVKLAHDAVGAWCDAARDEAERQLAAQPPGEVDLMVAESDVQAVADMARKLLVPYVHAWEAMCAALAELAPEYEQARPRGRVVAAILDNLYRPSGV